MTTDSRKGLREKRRMAARRKIERKGRDVKGSVWKEA